MQEKIILLIRQILPKDKPMIARPDGRSPEQLRKIAFFPGVAPHASGSVLACFGSTQVICSAMLEPGVPRWMKEQRVAGGWLTAEYSMLPYSTLGRKPRDISRGKLDGRSSEIQRLIGRSLRAVVDLKKLGQNTLWIDCDVLQADGGTRTAAITGACLACAIAFDAALDKAKLTQNPLKKFVAAISSGIYRDTPVLDLDYREDKDARVDANFVLTEDLDFVEVQSSGEEATFTESEFSSLQSLAKAGIADLVALQRQALDATRKPADGSALTDLATHFAR
ncbi:ribonuclease PH [soil metagenome]